MRENAEAQKPWIIIRSSIEPYPADYGARVRIWALGKALSQEYRVALVMSRPPEYGEALREVFAGVWFNPTLSPSGSKLTPRGLLRRLSDRRRIRSAKQAYDSLFTPFEGNPLVGANHMIAEELDRLCVELRPVAIIAEYVTNAVPAIPIARRHGISAIIDTHDVWSIRRQRESEAGVASKIAFEDSDEERLLQLADALIAIQPLEAEVLQRMAPDATVLVAEHPIDIVDTPDVPVDPNTVLFVGSKAHHNVFALTRFVAEQWHVVQDTLPTARLRVVGNIVEGVDEKTRTAENVEFVGFAEDVHLEYARAALVVNPAVYGSGLKIKSVEALAHGRPLLSTPVGIEGLEDGSDCAFVTAPFDGLGSRIVELLRNRERLDALGTGSRAFARERFSSERCFGPLMDYLRGIRRN